jgi:heme A synthase
MFELFKILWDVVVLRDATRKGQLNWRIWPMAFGLVLLLYGIGISAVLLYEKHPQYESLFIAALIFDAILFICFMWWAWRWQRQAAARKSTLAIVQLR